MMATARVHPADARSIFTGKHKIVNPVEGNCSRLPSGLVAFPDQAGILAVFLKIKIGVDRPLSTSPWRINATPASINAAFGLDSECRPP